MKTVLAVVGDYYHDPALAKESLEKAFAASGAAEHARLTFSDVSGFADALTSRPDLIVLFKEQRVNPQDPQVDEWMDESLSAGIERHVREGGAFLAWHSGLASYPKESAFIRMLRGYFLHHPSEHQTVTYTPSEAFREELPVKTFAFPDEHYFVHCDEANTEVFLRSESVDGQAVAGWRHDYGEGKVCCLTPAHRREGLLDSGFQQVMAHCLSWCLT